MNNETQRLLYVLSQSCYIANKYKITNQSNATPPPSPPGTLMYTYLIVQSDVQREAERVRQPDLLCELLA